MRNADNTQKLLSNTYVRVVATWYNRVEGKNKKILQNIIVCATMMLYTFANYLGLLRE